MSSPGPLKAAAALAGTNRAGVQYYSGNRGHQGHRFLPRCCAPWVHVLYQVRLKAGEERSSGGGAPFGSSAYVPYLLYLPILCNGGAQGIPSVISTTPKLACPNYVVYSRGADNTTTIDLVRSSGELTGANIIKRAGHGTEHICYLCQRQRRGCRCTRWIGRMIVLSHGKYCRREENGVSANRAWPVFCVCRVLPEPWVPGTLLGMELT